MILLCLLLAAEQSDAIKGLKAQERSLLDTIDDLVDERRKLDKRLKTVQSELVSLASMVETQKERLALDAKAHEVAAREARVRARSLSRIMRGQGARFVLGAEGFADGLRRMQLLQRVLRRDWIVLTRAIEAMEDQRDRVAAMKSNEQYANDMSEVLARLKLDALDQTQQLSETLLTVRTQRAQEERTFYDLKEFEAILKREDEEEKIAASGPFGEMRGRLRWPVHGAVSRNFGTYQEARFGFEVARSGIRIKAAAGTPVMSVYQGTVRFADPVTGYGRVVIVQHSDNYFGVYGGLAEARVSKGQTVQESTVLGAVSGDEAVRGGAYFELRRKTTAEEPTGWLTP